LTDSDRTASFAHWIGGQAVAPSHGEYFDSRNPIDDSLFARAAKANATDVSRAVESADDAFQRYRRTLPKEREGWLLRAAELLESQSRSFVDLLIDEVGSPIVKARREIATSIGLLRAAAGATRALAGKTMPTDVPGRISLSVRQPLGVIAGVTPFNVPLIKGIKHAAMPLATGNTVVLLPSEEAPGVAHAIGKLFTEAGFPAGALNVISGVGSEIGDSLTTHPAVRMVTFTGSSRVGAHIALLCGQHRKRVTLEMGGKNALVVLDDADLARAVPAGVLGSFMYQGQICMASSRIYVQRKVYETFLDRLVTAAEKLGMGDLRDESTVIGPIINERQRNRIREHLADAVTQGATVRCGNQWTQNRCHATVLTEVADTAILCGNETFGPVTSVYQVDTAEEALARANDTRYGLCGSVFTNDLNVAMRFANEMKAGMVHINGATIQDEPHVPFGGVEESGFGRESTDVDIADLTQWKWITIQNSLT